MQTVSVWISNVELARAPRSVTDLSPIEIGASDRELFGEFIDVWDNESVRWSIAQAEVLGLVPLKVKFHTVTPHAGVFRFDGCVSEGGLETKQLVELDGRCDVANHQYWLNRFELCHRVDPYGVPTVCPTCRFSRGGSECHGRRRLQAVVRRPNQARVLATNKSSPGYFELYGLLS
jgi:hypothetical protein